MTKSQTSMTRQFTNVQLINDQKSQRSIIQLFSQWLLLGGCDLVPGYSIFEVSYA